MCSPLVSFFIFSYDQEKYVRKAVQAALEQSYTPLEIIISDDCSTDCTYRIILDEVATYSGSKKIILNQNSSNLGVVAHINQVVSLASGELVVFAAGDDVSLPDRVSTLVSAWQEHNVSAVCSNAVVISGGSVAGGLYSALDTGVVSFERMAALGKSLVFGAGMAYEKAVFECFGPLPDTVRNEDMILPFRAALLNGVYFLNIPLVYYRHHAGNLSFWSKMSGIDSSEWLALRIEQIKNLIANYENWVEVVEVVEVVEGGVKVGGEKYALEGGLELIKNNILLHRAEMKLIKGSILGRLICLFGLLPLMVKNREMTLRLMLAFFSPGLYSRVMQILHQKRVEKKLLPLDMR